MQTQREVTDKALAGLTPRRRAVVKLRLGLALSESELESVRPEMREAAKFTRPRSLRDVAVFFGVSKERIRQIEDRAYALLGPEPPKATEAETSVAPDRRPASG